MVLRINLQIGHQKCTCRRSNETPTNSKIPETFPKINSVSRRWALTAGTLLSFCGEGAASASTTPYQDAATIQYGLRNGTIRPCPGGVNPNCVSTASLNDLYSPVWRSSGTDVSTSAQALESAVMAVCPEAKLVASQRLANGQFLAFTVPSYFGRDVLEFLLKDDRPAELTNDPSGTTSTEGPIVLYRSMAGSVKYIWPLQTAVSDLGTQRKRVESIRKALGWRLVGCDLLECYE
ncbi:probable thylakoid lumenal 17.9 kDa protein, chloroplastic [Coccomyxa sp. Obi]|nr:probable thylakoid lumenal 17.9 kDa protein, chloroplastic [Coccomyxa sp. Obi]